MSNPTHWLTRFKRRFRLTSGRTYQKISDNPSVILDDSLNFLNSIKNSSSDKLRGFVEEFNNALPITELAGYELKTVEIRLGIPPKLIPHFEQVREISDLEKNELMNRIQDRRYTRLLLSTLFKSTELQQSLQIGDLPLGVIQIELTAVPNIILVYGDY